MYKIGYLMCAAVVVVFILTGVFHTQGWAAVASCQIRTEGKLDCMEFSGNLPSHLKNMCGPGGSQNTKWVESPCPRDNVLGVCEVSRNDNIKQLVYCFRMNQLPDNQRLEYCRMSCKGAFSTASGGSSGAAISPITTSPQTSKPSGTTTPVVVASPLVPASTSASQYAMEQNINRAGDDYKDLDLNAPNPALCAQACANESKCKAWTYVKPGVQADNAKCWLKDRVPPRSPDENCVSGLKGKAGSVTPTTGTAVPAVAATPKPSASASTSQYAMEQGIDRIGDDYRDFDLTTPNPALCAQACMNEARCRAWTYVKPGVAGDKAHCWVKNRVPPPTPDANCVSGVKK
jgi:hypothetical protein